MNMTINAACLTCQTLAYHFYIRSIAFLKCILSNHQLLQCTIHKLLIIQNCQHNWYQWQSNHPHRIFYQMKGISFSTKTSCIDSCSGFLQKGVLTDYVERNMHKMLGLKSLCAIIAVYFVQNLIPNCETCMYTT